MKPIAIFMSDLHLSLTPPACRADKDWLAVQAGYLEQVDALREGDTEIPIIIAGDIFDRWNPPNELVHFALRHLPDNVMSIPGQHDLPNHRIDDMFRSGYGVLVEARKLQHIAGRKEMQGPGNTRISGFGWGQEITRPRTKDNAFQIAVIHKYIWAGDRKYPDAPADCEVTGMQKQFAGYDMVVAGDNHKGFLVTQSSGTRVLNCGGFIRRKSDEIDYRPCVGLLFELGTVKRHKLDTSADVFQSEVAAHPETAVDLQSFIQGLEELGEHGLNFREMVKNHLRTEDLSLGAKQIIMEALDAQAV